jgi:hypothetical protein
MLTLEKQTPKIINADYLSTLIDALDMHISQQDDKKPRVMISRQPEFENNFPNLLISKNRLMLAINTLFFDHRTKTVRKSALHTFCNDYCYTLVSVREVQAECAIIHMRFTHYDLVVTCE